MIGSFNPVSSKLRQQDEGKRATATQNLGQWRQFFYTDDTHKTSLVWFTAGSFNQNHTFTEGRFYEVKDTNRNVPHEHSDKECSLLLSAGRKTKISSSKTHTF